MQKYDLRHVFVTGSIEEIKEIVSCPDVRTDRDVILFSSW
jgi:hypothetical protein